MKNLASHQQGLGTLDSAWRGGGRTQLCPKLCYELKHAYNPCWFLPPLPTHCIVGYAGTVRHADTKDKHRDQHTRSHPQWIVNNKILCCVASFHLKWEFSQTHIHRQAERQVQLTYETQNNLCRHHLPLSIIIKATSASLIEIWANQYGQDIP